jgi:plastocyanin
MLSNHFPHTYGHDLNWLILLMICAGGAAIREYFVVRLSNPKRSMTAGLVGIALITGTIAFSQLKQGGTEEAVTHVESHMHDSPSVEKTDPSVPSASTVTPESLKGPLFEVKGVVNFEGAAPAGKKLNLPSGCAHPGEKDVYSNEVIVNNGKLKNVLVTLKRSEISGEYKDIPSEEVVLDQRGCMYTPRVAAARVGQKVTFVNSDPVFHNVRSVTSQNEKFNMAMPKKNQRETKVFEKPEMFLQTKCSVHPWMGAYVAVMDHPFYSITNDNGEFTLPKLPAGTYDLEAWHEVFGTQTAKVEVKEGSAPVTFTFKR